MTLLSTTRHLLAALCMLALPALVAAQPSTAFVKRLSDVEAQVASLQVAVAELRTQNAAALAAVAELRTQNAALQAALSREVADRTAYADGVAANALTIARSYADAKVAPLADKLVHVSRSGSDLLITGANLHLRNGTGGTNTANGLGNLVVGYNEVRGQGTANPDVRTGSHNLIVGIGANFSRNGAIIGGINNSSTGNFASVYGGTGNTAAGTFSVVVGGFNNVTNGGWSTILGGRDRTAAIQLDHLP